MALDRTCLGNGKFIWFSSTVLKWMENKQKKMPAFRECSFQDLSYFQLTIAIFLGEIVSSNSATRLVWIPLSNRNAHLSSNMILSITGWSESLRDWNTSMRCNCDLRCSYIDNRAELCVSKGNGRGIIVVSVSRRNIFGSISLIYCSKSIIWLSYVVILIQWVLTRIWGWR